jgi:peptidoglycan/xylan/chitin deacetylase (PgdA/CDA1 family)
VWCSLFVTRLSLFTPLNYSALITMRLSHVFTLPMVAMLVAARIPRYAAPSKRNMLESRQSGPTTRNDPRPQKGNIPYGGAGIVTCKQPGTVAITFDDGPNIYTGQVLNLLAQYGFKATFFVCGDNGHGALDADSRWIDVVRRMDAEGHQVGSHTWSHPHMNDITDDQRYDEMVKTEMAIRNILGKYPTYMRPPYTECNDACQTVMKNLGYVIANYDLDTQDWAHQDNIQEAKDIFYRGMEDTPGGPQSGHRVVLAHDIHEQTVSSLIPYMLEYLKTKGWKGVTLGECLAEPKENWYRPSDGSLPPSGCPTGGCPVSRQGLCGVQSAETCTGSAFGTCCSRFGYCGSTAAYCGADCDPAFGTCSARSASLSPNRAMNSTVSRTGASN